MKNLIFACLLVILLGCETVYAGCSLRAPGLPGIPANNSATSCPFKKEVTLPTCYKLSFTGCQGKGTALTNSGSGGGDNDDDDDDDDDDDGGGYSGGGGSGGGTSGFTCKATCKDDKPTPKTQSCQISFANVTEFNKCPLKKTTMPTACVFKADKTPMRCKLTWECNQTASKPDGIFEILSEFQKEPPPPTGNLKFQVGNYLLTAAGSQPPGVAVVTRE